MLIHIVLELNFFKEMGFNIVPVCTPLAVVEPHLNCVILISGVHISPRPRDRSCARDPLVQLKKIIRKAADEVHQYEEEHIKVPGKRGRTYGGIRTHVLQREREERYIVHGQYGGCYCCVRASLGLYAYNSKTFRQPASLPYFLPLIVHPFPRMDLGCR